MKLSIEDLRQALGEPSRDERAELEREKVRIMRERLELEKRKQDERERVSRERAEKGTTSGWAVSLGITAFILLTSLAFAVWVLSRF